MSEFVFDPVEHKYHVDGVEYPSITTLLKPLAGYDNIPEFVLQRAGAFGTAVHKAVELWLCGGDKPEMTEDVELCFSGFPRFWAEHPEWHDVPRIVEQPMYHPKLKYAGTADLILVDVATIEIKSRLFKKATDPLQLVAQENLSQANNPVTKQLPRYVLELHKNGTHSLINATDKQAWSKFRYLLDHHWHCREYEQNINLWRNQK